MSAFNVSEWSNVGVGGYLASGPKPRQSACSDGLAHPLLITTFYLVIFKWVLTE